MFKHGISLGNNCAMAASLSKYGLRSTSGPFDWVLTEFEGLINCLEMDFTDFLLDENISKIEGGRPKSFIDKKYNISYMHEVDFSFDDEFEGIKAKYKRRIEQFRKDIKENTCFVRSVFDEKELEFIQNNENKINKIIKKHNKENEIIYLIPNYLSIPKECNGKFFDIDVETYRGNKDVLRGIFDSNESLVNYLIKNFEKEKREENLIFDMKKEYKGLIKVKKDYDLLLRILKINTQSHALPNKVALYGFNENAKELNNRISESCEVKCFIDSNPKENMYNDIPVTLPEDYVPEVGLTVIVMCVEDFEKIYRYMDSIWIIKNINIISIEDLLNINIDI